MKKYVTPFNLTQLLETPVIKARTNITCYLSKLTKQINYKGVHKLTQFISPSDEESIFMNRAVTWSSFCVHEIGKKKGWKQKRKQYITSINHNSLNT